MDGRRNEPGGFVRSWCHAWRLLRQRAWTVLQWVKAGKKALPQGNHHSFSSYRIRMGRTILLMPLMDGGC